MYKPSSFKLQGVTVSIGAGVIERWEEPLVVGRQEGASAQEVALTGKNDCPRPVPDAAYLFFDY